MIKIIHENARLGQFWTCSCGELVTEAAACECCYGVFCAVCAASPLHAVPAGERAGKPCPSTLEAVQAA